MLQIIVNESQSTNDDNEEQTKEYHVGFWVDAECNMKVEATSEEEAIEEAKRSIEENMYYGMVSPTGLPDNFQVREMRWFL